MNDESILFICNPEANTGRLKKRWPKVQDELKNTLDSDSYEIKFTESRLHGMSIAEEAIDSGYKTLISVGGDGTTNEICNAIMKKGKGTNLGILPMGTSNDINLTYGLPLDPIENLKRLLDQNVRKYPIGLLTNDILGDYYFLDHCDCGLAAQAALSVLNGGSFLKGEIKYTYHDLFCIYIHTFSPNPACRRQTPTLVMWD
ncbi:MAG: diacylglycerol kinase family protein [Candidatus Heimdallarchaeota archaeon]|nr:diacylglycerol kinase family protein [Candidatus Heimdallarchaeota archaeon]